MRNIFLMIGLVIGLSAFQPGCPPRCVVPTPFTPEVTLVRVTSTITPTPRPTKTPTVTPTVKPIYFVYLPIIKQE